MKLALVTTSFPEWPLLRQTPGGSGRWGDWIFSANQGLPAADAWVVFDGPRAEMTVRCPRGRLVLFTTEPAEVHRYDERYLAQFDRVVTCQDVGHPNVVRRQQAQPWHAGVVRDARGGAVGRMGYDDFRKARVEKTREISVICSNKAMTAGHRARLRFVEALREHFRGRIDCFGRGFTGVADKWEAIAPYRYHVVLENGCVANYWTEKLADAYLAGAFPLYAGCPNLKDYFPEEAFAPLAIDRPGEAIGVIERVLASGAYERHAGAIAAARTAVLDRYNFFPAAVELCEGVAAGPMTRRRVLPESAFRGAGSERSIIKRVVQKTLSTIALAGGRAA